MEDFAHHVTLLKHLYGLICLQLTLKHAQLLTCLQVVALLLQKVNFLIKSSDLLGDLKAKSHLREVLRAELIGVEQRNQITCLVFKLITDSV